MLDLTCFLIFWAALSCAIYCALLDLLYDDDNNNNNNNHHHHHHTHRHCYHHYLLLPLCRVLKITYPKQTVLPGYMALTAVLYLQFIVHVMLFPMFNVLFFNISTFQRMCTEPNTAVVSSSLISCFPGMLLRYIMNDMEMVLGVPVITGITLAFTIHMCYISIARCSHFLIFSG